MKSIATKQKLGEAAAQQFLLRGYAGTSLAAIAEQIGLTKGAFSHHFRAKADLAAFFHEITRKGAEQSEAFSAEAHPDLGLERLILHFLVLSKWRQTEPCFAAAVALFTDKASPTYEDATIIRAWHHIAETAFTVADSQGRRDQRVPAAQAADFFLAATLGATTYPVHALSPSFTPGNLLFLRQSLVGAGVGDGHELVSQVIEAHADHLPTLEHAC